MKYLSWYYWTIHDCRNIISLGLRNLFIWNNYIVSRYNPGTLCYLIQVPYFTHFTFVYLQFVQIQIPVNDFLFLKKLQIIKSGIKHYKLYNFVLQHRLLFPAGPVCWSPNVLPSRLSEFFWCYILWFGAHSNSSELFSFSQRVANYKKWPKTL